MVSDAIGTIQVNLMRGVGGSGTVWSRLVEIKDFPDLQGIIEGIDKTTTNDDEYLYHEGIRGNEQKAFTCNYNDSDFKAIEALKDIEIPIAIWFGVTQDENVRTPDGSLGKYAGRGFVSAYIDGSGTNEVVNMTVVVTLTHGLFEAWDSILVDWTTNTGEAMRDSDGNVMCFDISHGGNSR